MRYIHFALRVLLFAGFIAAISVTPFITHNYVFAHSLQELSRQSDLQEYRAQEMRDSLIHAEDNVADHEKRIAALEGVKSDARLLILEAQANATGWLVKIIVAAAVANILSLVAKGAKHLFGSKDEVRRPRV